MLKLLILFLFIIKSICAGNILTAKSFNPGNGTKPTPIVFWHGMGDTCCASFSLGYLILYIQKQIPGVYIHSLRIGDNTIEDLENGYLMHPNKQVQIACKKLAENPNFAEGFNAIGFSQGSQFLRGLVQRCGQKLKVKNLISIGGQHQGVYGLPRCGALQHKTCDYVRKLLNYAAYYPWVQESLVQATYWHDPLNEKEYKENSQFLSDINNELTINTTYIDNLNNLEHFVLVKFNNDTIVQPKETEWFGFYKPGQAKELLTLQESRLYLEDRLGLQQMTNSSKLVFLSVDGDHLHLTEEWMDENIIKPYLLN